ncbi:hypothetical protein R83H12_00659 [Fibrobacteria bacterium R8-3-H12]
MTFSWDLFFKIIDAVFFIWIFANVVILKYLVKELEVKIKNPTPTPTPTPPQEPIIGVYKNNILQSTRKLSDIFGGAKK